MQCNQEQLSLFVLVSLWMTKRFEAIAKLKAQTGIDFDEDPESFNQLPVTNNFKGNFWRLAALFALKNQKLTEERIKIVEKRLLQAKKYFELDNSQWGLGLTCNILGRIYSFKDDKLENTKENIRKSKQYYIQALDNFN